MLLKRTCLKNSILSRTSSSSRTYYSSLLSTSTTSIPIATSTTQVVTNTPQHVQRRSGRIAHLHSMLSSSLPLASSASSSSMFMRTFATAATAAESVPRNSLFDKILIANRGEIAIRIMTTAKKLGIKTVAVYSEADKDAMHVQMADEAYLIGPAASSESYLNMKKILQVAKISGAQAIHPGYGFLSENSDFAQAVKDSGLVFIGPPVQAIIDMGSKSASKKIMSAAKVPVVPGYHGENQSVEFLKSEAEKIGYPVLIKAVKGGGGKGMRIVETADDFEVMLESAKREAIKHFSDDKLLVEKYLVKPRHVEVQVFADQHSNAVYLFERDCSVQRRHQKILEEAPAPGLSEELRRSLGEKAVAAAKAVGYEGAGTVEFILDTITNKFYFMEMNTRLQVEHPVTEMVTNTDLVQWQLEVASGNRLPLLQKDIKLAGHAFEARIYAETPENNFLPDTGSLVHMKTPHAFEGGPVRVETGVKQSDEVSVHYDPMICKLVVKGPNRIEALRLMAKNLGEFQVVGLNTNIEFLKSVVEHKAFIDADLDTGFIKRYQSELFKVKDLPEPHIILHAALGQLAKELYATNSPVSSDPWSSLTYTRLNTSFNKKVEFGTHQDAKKSTRIVVDIKYLSQEELFKVSVQIGADNIPVVFENVNILEWNPQESELKLDINGQIISSTFVHENDEKVHVYYEGQRETLSVPLPAHLKLSSSGQDLGGQVVTPMPCKISQILVQPGEKIESGVPLVVLEAMKMEHLIRAPRSGTVKEIRYKVGDIIGQNKVLLTFEDD